MALVEIATFTSRSEAEVAAAALRACGLQAVTFDDGIGGAAYQTGLSEAGFRVLGLASEKEEAIATLEQLQANPPEA
jgi:hypothetical protein